MCFELHSILQWLKKRLCAAVEKLPGQDLGFRDTPT